MGRANAQASRHAMQHMLGEGLRARALPLFTYLLKARLYSWGLRRAPIGEVDNSGGAALAGFGIGWVCRGRHQQAEHMPGMSQTSYRGASRSSQLELQRAQTAAGVRGMRSAL